MDILGTTIKFVRKEYFDNVCQLEGKYVNSSLRKRTFALLKLRKTFK